MRHDHRSGRQSTVRNPGKDAEVSHTGGERPSNDFRNGGGSATIRHVPAEDLAKG